MNLQYFICPGQHLDTRYQGRIQDFKLGGGTLKKIVPNGGRRENFGGISCEKSRFYAKKSYFFQFYGGGGALGAPPPPGSAPGYPHISETLSYLLTPFYPMLHVSLECQFLIAASVFSYVGDSWI